MKFKSKAQTLKFLSKYQDLRVPKLIIFEARKYKINPNYILKAISKSFHKKVAIRSSNVFEDKNNNIKAGVFTSYLNINPKFIPSFILESSQEFFKVSKNLKNAMSQI